MNQNHTQGSDDPRDCIFRPRRHAGLGPNRG